MIDEDKKLENILKILKLLTQDSARLESLLSEFLEQAAIREFDDEHPIEESGLQKLRGMLSASEKPEKMD